MARVLCCPDSFKGSLDALTAARSLAAGWTEVRPDDQVCCLAQADGGEGTVAAVAAGDPSGHLHEVAGLTGPDHSPVTARWYRLGDIGVCEVATVAGLPLMPTPDALGATSRGVGELIAAAIDAGCREVFVGLGGSASTDGGAGALAALGHGLFAADGSVLPDGGGALTGLARIVRPAQPPACRVTLVTDVTAPLLGDGGAAAVFGPQKGADAADVVRLEAGLTRWAELLGGPTDQPGMGAAGGLGYGLVRGLGAQIVDGAAWVATRTGLTEALAASDLVITGEGRFDATSLTGKVVGHVVALGEAHGVPVQVVAGQVEPVAGVAARSLVEWAGDPPSAMADPQRWLRAAGRRLAEEFGDR
ncbi:glycerate kinase [Propionibacteriaceae bacterium Y2011]|uniref:glycerate kinase family protein n=1 Tax=Microlunatus sp. Y2014 TaxID=3418488 RepID=UPI003B474B94